MIHIRKEVKRKKDISFVAVCQQAMKDDDTFTNTALASNCDACRQLVGVGGTKEKTWEGTLLGVRPVPEWTPSEPLRDANGKIYEREKS